MKKFIDWLGMSCVLPIGVCLCDKDRSGRMEGKRQCGLDYV